MPSQAPIHYTPDNYERDSSLGWLLKRVMASIAHEVGQRLTPLGLTHAQWSPLLRLRLTGECSAATLVSELGLDAGAMSRLLDRLEAKGLVERSRCNHDRRVVMVSLTEAGREATAGVPEVLAEVFNAHLAGFSHTEWQSLISMLQRLVANGEALRAAAGTDNPSNP